MAADEDEDLDLGAPDAGVAFRGEMFAQYLLLGYWQWLVAGLAAILAVVLFWGQWDSWVERKQRAATEKIAVVEEDLSAPVFLMSDAFRNPNGDVDVEAVKTAAASLEQLAKESDGTASTEAYLKAAELYRVSGLAAEQRTALEAAVSVVSSGPLSYAARAGLANLDLEEGRGDDAVTRLKGLFDEFDGYLGEQAALDLALAYEHLGRESEAQTVYTQFIARWPESKRIEEVKARQTRVSGDG